MSLTNEQSRPKACADLPQYYETIPSGFVKVDDWDKRLAGGKGKKGGERDVPDFPAESKQEQKKMLLSACMYAREEEEGRTYVRKRARSNRR